MKVYEQATEIKLIFIPESPDFGNSFFQAVTLKMETLQAVMTVNSVFAEEIEVSFPRYHQLSDIDKLYVITSIPQYCNLCKFWVQQVIFTFPLI